MILKLIAAVSLSDTWISCSCFVDWYSN